MSKSACSRVPFLKNYRLYLSDTNSLYGVNFPYCYLSEVTPSTNTTPHIVIPKEAAPPGNTYRIYVLSFNTSSHVDDEGGLPDYTASFELEGTEVKGYSAQEWSGPYGEYDSIPCSAMQCNRKCKENSFATKTAAYWTYDKYCDCLRQCPGVTTGNPNYGNGCGYPWRQMQSTTVLSTKTTIGSIATTTSVDATSTGQTSSGSSLPGTTATVSSVSTSGAMSNVATPTPTSGANRAAAPWKPLAVLAPMTLKP